ncbi:unnamed protein product [Rotaria socialis]|uniref:NAD(P)(+)--arginine ADP-ribosyltransferase n=1 Tax=Rotaria socialis TaxID=392032 RepID=A0A820UPG4_9BILA|nr:unnamed protein product [Rotaria socialis]CAF4488288.1 unnamed protein product [Rotaria socialis]
MTHINSRLLDASEERLNSLTPLRGYAEERLVKLVDAVVSLRKLVHDIDARVWTATKRSENPTDELTPDESAAIILYTIEWDPSHPSLYFVLNGSLRLEDRRKLVPWFSYLKLLLTGLYKLPSIRCTVWRGVRGDLRSHYKLGAEMTWWAFSSCTASISVLESEQYLGTSGTRTLFAIECLNGKDIKRHSYFAQEEEILLLPCTHFKVISHLSSMENLHIIHLREITPPFMLLEPPDATFLDSHNDNASYEQLKAKLEQVTDENKRLTTKCKQQEVQINQQQIQINELENENQILNKNYADYENEMQRLKAKSQRSEKAVERLKQEADESDKLNERLQVEIQNLQKEIERLKRTADRSSERPKASLAASDERLTTASSFATPRTTGPEEFDVSENKLIRNRLCTPWPMTTKTF